ncbi:MAG: hypothetical protein ACRC63_01410, partial [Metamycoplasmataceae bacterium]
DTGFQGDFVSIDSVGTDYKNAYVKYGFDKDLVGFSASSLSGNDATIANKALQNAFTRYKAMTPTFQSMTNAGANQGILNGLVAEINGSNRSK